MKKFLLALGVVAALSLLFVGCDKPTDEPETTAETTFDGNVDLTKLAGYDAAAGGIVKDFGTATSGYATVASFVLSDLGYTADSGFKKVAVVADVYNGDTKYDLASNYSARIMITVGDTSNDDNKNFNAGVANATQAVSAATDTLLIQIKGEPVTKVVIKAITFSK